MKALGYQIVYSCNSFAISVLYIICGVDWIFITFCLLTHYVCLLFTDL